MSVPALSQFAVDLLVAWGAALAITTDLVIVLTALTRRAADARRPVLLAMIATIASRLLVTFTGAPGLPVVSACFGVLALVAGWWLFGERGPAPPRVLDLAAVLTGVVLGAFAISATGGAPAPVLGACLLALVGVPWSVRRARRWADRVPDLVVGCAVVVVFLGVRSLLAGISGRAPAQDASVLALSLGMTALVVLLCAITTARARR
ncbi:hypothetical protein [Saccharopolyspora griseoalba]|uniref:Uncharacterized protein n=1 Tax=Saccharopolyspora griseoalba TaxID=1431848 RepID=A0ABW2LFZ8_9PSEU